jgi:crotonobetainyl-CoA:carnitine CoA-transferase CaiB-like acyl-CoA transferase
MTAIQKEVGQEGIMGGDGPLQGIRVFDLSNLLAGPMTTMYLADFGADVIKVERPPTGDELRKWGNRKGDVGLMFKLVNRNKRLITLDLHMEEGQALARQLILRSDVVVESFRPGTLEGWGLGYEDLKRQKPELVMARVTGFGQSGPYATRRGFGSIGEAMSGFAYVTGEPDGAPILPTFGLGDTTTAIFSAFGVLMALWNRTVRGAGGQCVDAALYEGLITLLGAHVVDYDQLGIVQERTGSRLPFAAPRNCYRTRDGKWLVLAGSTQRTFEAIAHALGAGELCSDPRFVTNSDRVANVEPLDRALQARVAHFDLVELLDLMDAAGAPAFPIYSVEDLLRDPHVAARQNVVQVEDTQLGPLRMQNVLPRLEKTPGTVRWAGATLGAHNEEVYQKELGLSDEDLTSLRDKGVI